MTATDHTTSFPLLPRTLNVLVAGHRNARLGDDPARAVAALRTVLRRLAEPGRDAALADRLFGARLYAGGGCTVRIMTGDADGTDAHAAAIAQELGIAAQVVAAGDSTLAPAAAVRLGCPADVLKDDDHAYALRDELALLHADVLVAVWDGHAPAGRSGGVVRLIQQAIECGTPVLWIDLAGTIRELDEARLDGARSLFVALNTLGATAHRDLWRPVDDALTPALLRWLDPLAAADGGKAAIALRKYAQERAGTSRAEPRAGLLDRALSALVTSGTISARGWDATQSYLDLPDAFPPDAALARRFAWHDVRASVAAGRHRDHVWLLYLLSASAVLVALLGAMHVGVEHEGWGLYFWSAVEAGVLGAILLLLRRGKEKQWHARWLGHRFMAEQVRLLLLTRPFLAVAPALARPLFGAGAGAGTELISAEAWLLRRTAIGAGLPRDAEFCHATPVQLRDYLAGAVATQHSFHHKKVHKLHVLHERMHGTAKVLFGLSLLGVALHFALPSFGVHDMLWLLLLTAFLPALAAALHGIQTKLEVGRVLNMSETMAAGLATLQAAILAHDATLHERPWHAQLYLRRLALHAAQVMAQETAQWHALIGEQAPELPA